MPGILFDQHGERRKKAPLDVILKVIICQENMSAQKATSGLNRKLDGGARKATTGYQIDKQGASRTERIYAPSTFKLASVLQQI